MLQTINLETHLQQIADRGWTTFPIDHAWAQTLSRAAQSRQKNLQFKTAHLSSTLTPHLEIRNDQIFWLDAKTPNLEVVEQETLSGLDSLRLKLQDFFRIHLSEFECHYALYEPGHFYQRHRDTTEANNRRIFSFVIYFNENWLDNDQGELWAFQQEQILFMMKPQLGTMILFKSDIEHEVKPTLRSRWSLTGWFRK